MTKRFLDEEIPDDPQLFHPVYITSDEREKFNGISRMSTDVVRGKILKRIDDIVCCST